MRRHRDPSIALAAFPIAAIVTGIFSAAPAYAQSGTCGTAAGFQIDGQLFSGPGDDWAQGSSGLGVFLGPARTVQLAPASSFRDPHWAGASADPSHFDGDSNKNDDYIGAGQEPWTSILGSGPQKDDLTDIYIHTRTDPGTGHLWLIVGGTTRAVNGDSHVDFEVNRAGISLVGGTPDRLVGNGPAGGRSIGDLIVSADYALGGTDARISVRRWQEDPPSSGHYAYVDATANTEHFMCVDTQGALTGPWGGIAPDGTGIPAGDPMIALQFFEGAVDLTQAGFVENDPCQANPTVIVKSRSSDSFPAELKDYALHGFSLVPQVACSPRPNRPRTAGFWSSQCAQRGNGSTKYTAAEMILIAQRVNERSAFFDWPAGAELPSFCALITPPKPMDQRKQALRQYATFLANWAAGDLSLIASNGDTVSLDLTSPVSCGGLSSATLDQLIGEVDAMLASLGAQSLENEVTKSAYSDLISCLDAINNGSLGQAVVASEQVDDGATGTDPNSTLMSVKHALSNPFRGASRFAVTVLGSGSGRVSIRITDVQGRLVRTFADHSLAPGQYQFSWDGTDRAGRKLSAGLYFLTSTTAGSRTVSKFVYLNP